MKIIKKGNIQQNLWIGKCKFCGAIAECEKDEIKYFAFGDYRNDYENFSWEDCPFCNTKKKMLFKNEANWNKKILTEAGKQLEKPAATAHR